LSLKILIVTVDTILVGVIIKLVAQW